MPIIIITIMPTDEGHEQAFKFFSFHVYLLLEGDRVRAGEGQREREGDTESEEGSGLRAVSTEPDEGLEPTVQEIMT